MLYMRCRMGVRPRTISHWPPRPRLRRYSRSTVPSSSDWASRSSWSLFHSQCSARSTRSNGANAASRNGPAPSRSG